MTPTSAKPNIAVPGFIFSGMSAGIKKSGERDLALIYSEVPAVTAAVFTQNRIKAAPVILAQEKLSRLKQAQAVLINSGNANACTGKRGFRDAGDVIRRTAEELGISPELVHSSSTGLIGKPLPLQKIRKAIPRAVSRLSPLAMNEAASSILTTDTFAKTASRKFRLGNRNATIAGIAKGAGMICPDMATMLCFLFTDAAVHRGTLDHALRSAVNGSFNRLAVDNDMSTNDTVMLMANGYLGNKPLRIGSADYGKFEKALNELTGDLARMIVRDGEGATKTAEIVVKGASTETDAVKVARCIANSMLVKTAFYGGDPNWGRVMAAIGHAGADVDEHKIDIFIGRNKLVHRGVGTRTAMRAAKALAKDRFTLTVNLRKGRKGTKFLTCDLTEGYIRINAHYST